MPLIASASTLPRFSGARTAFIWLQTICSGRPNRLTFLCFLTLVAFIRRLLLIVSCWTHSGPGRLLAVWSGQRGGSSCDLHPPNRAWPIASGKRCPSSVRQLWHKTALTCSRLSKWFFIGPVSALIRSGQNAGNPALMAGGVFGSVPARKLRLPFAFRVNDAGNLGRALSMHHRESSAAGLRIGATLFPPRPSRAGNRLRHRLCGLAVLQASAAKAQYHGLLLPTVAPWVKNRRFFSRSSCSTCINFA